MKKILAMVLSVILLLSCFSGCSIDPPVNNESETVDVQESPVEDFEYLILNDGTIEITYNGQDEYVSVPKQIDGKHVTAIANNGFQKAKSFLKTVILPDTITTIGSKAFMNCSLLEYVNMPNSLSHIGECAFKGCKSLTNIAIYSNCLNENSVEAFALSGLKEIALCEGVTYIPSYCFVETQISRIKLPSTVQEIGDCAFSSCKLEEILLNEGLVTIGNKAFAANLNLKEAVIPKTVINITEMAFSGCSALKKIIFEGNAPISYKYSDSISGIAIPVNTNYTIYYNHDAEGFTTPEWEGYPTEILPQS